MGAPHETMVTFGYPETLVHEYKSVPCCPVAAAHCRTAPTTPHSP